MKDLKVRLTFVEPVLGTASANPELYEEFIGSKRPGGPDPDEVETIPDVDEEVRKGTTVFHRKDETPILYDYQIKGFFKDACGMLRRTSDGASPKLKAYKKEIDGLIFVTPRHIPMNVNGEGLTFCTRPLRAQTAQGERVSLARSEQAPAGTTMEFTVSCLKPALERLVEEWLDYGKLRGLGQWRNSGMGRFTYDFID